MTKELSPFLLALELLLWDDVCIIKLLGRSTRVVGFTLGLHDMCLSRLGCYFPLESFL